MEVEEEEKNDTMVTIALVVSMNEGSLANAMIVLNPKASVTLKVSCLGDGGGGDE